MRSTVLAGAALTLLCLGLAACGPSGEPSPASSPQAESSSPVADAAGSDQGRYALNLRMDGTLYETRGETGMALRQPVVGAEGIDVVTLEVYNSTNTVYAKAELFVAAGDATEGEYALGFLGDDGVRNAPRRGQLVLATEDADGRKMTVSKDGRLQLQREGSGWLAEFEFSRNGFMGDSPVSAAGELRVGEGSDLR